jgi:hypothetical protein
MKDTEQLAIYIHGKNTEDLKERRAKILSYLVSRGIDEDILIELLSVDTELTIRNMKEVLLGFL